MKPRPISHGSELVIAFFLGSATDAIAWDWSDVAAFIGLPGCGSNNVCVAWYYDWLPFLYAFAFAVMAYFLAKFTGISNRVVLYLYLFATFGALVGGLFIPGAIQPVMLFTILVGTLIAAGLTLGMIKRTAHYRK